MPDEPPQPLQFDNRNLESKPSYVGWVDMMGARNAMAHSLGSSSNHIGRIHAAILRSSDSEVRVYPVMDGAYITSEKKDPMVKTLTGFLMLCAQYFASEPKAEHRFMVRGGLAYGPVIHGCDITTSHNQELGNAEDYRKNLLFGIPMIQANRGEGQAPPFGIFLDESVRSFSGHGAKVFSGVWWKWWNGTNRLPDGFTDRLQEHFKWSTEHCHRIEYPEDRLKLHSKLAKQYFDYDETN